MGKVILCTGQRATKPYTVRTSGVKVFTIEELCYCLHAQLDMLDESVIDREMAQFIRDELGLTERGELLEQLIATRADLKSRLVVIFCTCDYYDEAEISTICAELDELTGMSATARRLRRANRYMAEGRYKEAMHEYRAIAGAAHELEDTDYGNMLHNMAVIEIRTGRYDSAAASFLNAYEHNHAYESLKSYFFALKLGHREAEYVNEAMRLFDNGEQLRKLEEEFENVSEKAETGGELDQVDRLKVLYQQGRTSEFDRLAEEMINDLKRNYRASAEEI